MKFEWSGELLFAVFIIGTIIPMSLMLYDSQKKKHKKS